MGRRWIILLTAPLAVLWITCVNAQKYKASSCPKFQPFDNGEVTYNKDPIAVATVAVFNCDSGADLIPKVTHATCMPDKTWTYNPRCRRQLKLHQGIGERYEKKELHWGRPWYTRLYDGAVLKHDKEVRMHCYPDSEYELYRYGIFLNTKYFSSKNNDGVWDPELPSCKPKRCDVPNTYHGTDSYDDESVAQGKLLHGTDVTTECDEGYEVSRGQTVSVTSCTKGRLSTPRCSEKPCPVPKDPPDFTRYSPSYGIVYHGRKMSVRCSNASYELVTKNSRGREEYHYSYKAECKLGQRGELAFCKERRCTMSDLDDYGYDSKTDDAGRDIRASHIASGSDVTVSCDEGNQFKGLPVNQSRITLTCDKGQFQNAIQCEPKPCFRPRVEYAYNREQYKRVEHSKSITITCKPGYELSDGYTTLDLTCQFGKFQPERDTNIPKECTEKGCDILKLDDHNYKPLEDEQGRSLGTMASRDTLTATCKNGYHLQDDDNEVQVEISCDKGTLENDIPCQPKCIPGRFGEECFYTCTDCLNGGHCNEQKNACECTPGWMGAICNDTCQGDVYGQDCNSPCRCQNGGTCHHVTGKCSCPPSVKGEFCEDGCPAGRYGENCDKPCKKPCKGGRCDRHYGLCECAPGFFGSSCEIPCPEFIYGLGCYNFCECVKKNTISCDPADGRCTCKPGFHGQFCDKKCPLGYYGINCATPCDCDADMECDRVTGYCTHNCPPGNMGPDCTQPCARGHYGKDCAATCQCGHHGCDPVTGDCTCPVGLRGPLCVQMCPEGTYGDGCTGKCRCENGAHCHPQNGKCTCVIGYVGQYCDRACPAGRHGVNCAQTCDCVNSAECDFKTGECLCTSGWHGARCEMRGCGIPGEVLNGVVEYLDVYDTGIIEHRDNVKVVCSEGFEITEGENSRTVTCRLGVWKEGLPSECTPKKCIVSYDLGDLDVMTVTDTHGKNWSRNTLVDSGVKLEPTCYKGFEPRTGQTPQVSCDHGNWTDTFICVERNCSTPDLIEGTVYNWPRMCKLLPGKHVSRGDKVRVNCKEGYKIEGSANQEDTAIFTCDDGEWNKPINCVTKTCELKVGEGATYFTTLKGNVKVVTQDTILQHSTDISIHCLDGYELTDATNAVTNETAFSCNYGEFDKQITCEKEKCHLKTIDHGEVRLNGKVYSKPYIELGQQIKINCNKGYQIVMGNKIMSRFLTNCRNGNKLSRPLPICERLGGTEPIECRYPPKLEYSVFVNDTRVLNDDYAENGTKVEIVCKHGQGSTKTKCADGQWRPEIAECEAETAENTSDATIKEPVTGCTLPVSNKYTFGDGALDPGEQVDEGSLTKVDCVSDQYDLSGDYGDLYGTYDQEEQDIFLLCQDGELANFNESLLNCPEVLSCQCDQFDHGTVKDDYGTISVECDKGYSLNIPSNDNDLKCEKDGLVTKRTDKTPECTPDDCQLPNSIRGMQLEMFPRTQPPRYLSGFQKIDHFTTILVNCTNGGTEPNNRKFRCEAAHWYDDEDEWDVKTHVKNWTEGAFPECRGAVCDPPCANGGTCIRDDKCRCLTGTEGKLCDKYTCPKLCKDNGGVCNTSNTCTCPNNRYGSYCDQLLSEKCEKQLLNGGVEEDAGRISITCDWGYKLTTPPRDTDFTCENNVLLSVQSRVRPVCKLAPGSAPRDVRVKPQSPSTVVVEWDEPEITNGVITGYRVYYTMKDDYPIVLWRNQNVESNVRMATISGLEPNKIFTICVLAYSDSWQGLLSYPVRVITLQRDGCKTPTLDANIIADMLKESYDPREEIRGLKCKPGYRLVDDSKYVCQLGGAWLGNASCEKIQMTKYRIRVNTAVLNRPGSNAGTDANVFLTLYGRHGEVSNEIELTRELDGHIFKFEEGDTDVFEEYFNDVGQIREIKIRLSMPLLDIRRLVWSGRIPFDVTIYDTTRQQYYSFYINTWIKPYMLQGTHHGQCGDEFSEGRWMNVPSKQPNSSARDEIGCNLKCAENRYCHAAAYRKNTKECFSLTNWEAKRITELTHDSRHRELVYIRHFCRS